MENGFEGSQIDKLTFILTSIVEHLKLDQISKLQLFIEDYSYNYYE